MQPASPRKRRGGALARVGFAGLLGGFTTYGAFGLFSYELLREERLGVLATQIGLHLVLGIAGVAAGTAMGRVTVEAFNDFVPQASEPRLFIATIRVLADDCGALDERDVFILVPPAELPPPG